MYVRVCAYRLPYVTIMILAGAGIIWVMRLNKALGTYDPLFIIPLLQVGNLTVSPPSHQNLPSSP